MVPQTRKIDNLRIYKIPDEVIKLIKETTKNRKSSRKQKEKSSSSCIDTFTQSFMLASPLPPFLDVLTLPLLYFSWCFYTCVNSCYFTGVWVTACFHIIFHTVRVLQPVLIVFPWFMNDSKYLQVSRKLLIILGNFNSAVVSMISILRPISTSASLFHRYFQTVLSDQTIFDIYVIIKFRKTFALWQGLGICRCLRFLWFSLRAVLKRQNS